MLCCYFIPHDFHDNNRLCDVNATLYFKLRLYLHMYHIDVSMNTITQEQKHNENVNQVTENILGIQISAH